MSTSLSPIGDCQRTGVARNEAVNARTAGGTG